MTVYLLGPLNYYQKTLDILRCFSFCLEFQSVSQMKDVCARQGKAGATELMQRPSESLSQHDPTSPPSSMQASEGGSRGVPPFSFQPLLPFPSSPAGLRSVGMQPNPQKVWMLLQGRRENPENGPSQALTGLGNWTR